MKTKKVFLVVALMLLGLGGYFANQSVANASNAESQELVLDGTYGHDATSAWCDPSTDDCATIRVVGEIIIIYPEYAPGEEDPNMVSFEITAAQLSTLQAGGSIPLPTQY